MPNCWQLNLPHAYNESNSATDGVYNFGRWCLYITNWVHIMSFCECETATIARNNLNSWYFPFKGFLLTLCSYELHKVLQRADIWVFQPHLHIKHIKKVTNSRVSFVTRFMQLLSSIWFIKFVSASYKRVFNINAKMIT